GFPIQNPSDFNVVEAFSWEEFPYHGGAAPRSNVICRVFTANESPPKPFPTFTGAGKKGELAMALKSDGAIVVAAVILREELDCEGWHWSVKNWKSM
ncbi:hypothetical protein HN873_033449, partial [Arachis hypogaea]